MYPLVVDFLVDNMYVSLNTATGYKEDGALLVTVVFPILTSGAQVRGNCNCDPVPTNVSVSCNEEIKYVWVVRSNFILIKFDLTTPLPIVAITLATVPTVPPSNSTVGDDRYPVPGVSKTILLTVPLATNALAVAPLPELLVILTVGAI